MMIKNKILIITSLLTKDFRHLYGLVSQQEINNKDNLEKVIGFYEYKKEGLKSYQYDKKLIELLKTLKDKHGENIIIVNQEVDDIFDKHNIDAINLHGNIEEYKCLKCNKINQVNICIDCNAKNLIPNITLKDEKGQYQQVVEYIDECQSVIFIGDMGQLDPTLFIDEMLDSLYINVETQTYSGENPHTSKKEFVHEYFEKKNIIDSYDNSCDDIEKFINLNINNQEIIDKNNPYKDEGKEIIEIVNTYFEHLVQKFNIERKFNDQSLIKKLHTIFPFTNKLPEVYIGTIWYTYCKDINISPTKIEYNDLFYDMLLVYSKYKWEGMKKFYTKRPKVSLTGAYNENNDKSINIFKKILLKQDFIE